MRELGSCTARNHINRTTSPYYGESKEVLKDSPEIALAEDPRRFYHAAGREEKHQRIHCRVRRDVHRLHHHITSGMRPQQRTHDIPTKQYTRIKRLYIKMEINGELRTPQNCKGYARSAETQSLALRLSRITNRRPYSE